MTIYEKNLKQLKVYRNQLYNVIKKHNNSQESYINKIESCEAKDGTKILVVELNEKKYRLNSYYNPKQEADRWVDQFKFNNTNCVISFFGFGNGIFVRSLARRINNSDIIVVYEPSIDIFLYVIKEFDISDIIENENIYFFIKGINDVELQGVLNKIVDWSNLSSQILCCHPFYDQIFIYDYKNFLKKLNDNNTLTFINRNTAAIMGKASVKNTILNFKYIKESNAISDLYGIIPEDIPAIIVAAGPSLEKNIRDLKNAKNKSIIFATDRALDFLLDNDIEPDFIVTLDAIKPVKYFTSRENIVTPIFCKIESNSEILDFHKGKKIWYDPHSFFTNLYNKFNKKFKITNSGGSVATAAFSICIELKLKNIILIGQDLAYSGKFTHAGGVLDNGVSENSYTELVEDINGNMIPTRYDWKFFKLWFEDAIENYPEVNVIDATEGGAKIKGTKVMTLNRAISEYCKNEINCKDIMNGIPRTLNSEEFKYVKEYVKDAIKDLDELNSNLDKVVDICNKLLKASEIKKVNSKENQTLIKKLSDINKCIIEKPIYSLLDVYISDSSVNYLSTVYAFSGKEEDDQRNTFAISLRMYNDMKSADKEIKCYLNELIEVL